MTEMYYVGNYLNEVFNDENKLVELEEGTKLLLFKSHIKAEKFIEENKNTYEEVLKIYSIDVYFDVFYHTDFPKGKIDDNEFDNNILCQDQNFFLSKNNYGGKLAKEGLYIDQSGWMIYVKKSKPRTSLNENNIEQPFKINEIIIKKLKSQHMQKMRLAEAVNIHHKTIYDKLNFDRFDSAYALLKIAKVLRIDLNELRDQIEL